MLNLIGGGQPRGLATAASFGQNLAMMRGLSGAPPA
jgi:hypothetical protein